MSRPTWENKYKVNDAFVYGAITRSGSAFQLLQLASKISYLTRSPTGVVHKKNDLSKDRYFFLVVYQLATPSHYSSVDLSLENQRKKLGLDCSRFARRYFENRCYFPFLAVLRCFSSRTYLQLNYQCLRKDKVHLEMTEHYLWRVSPFGNPRVITFVRQLPGAYRSPLRPSSVSYVKAFTMRPFVTFYAFELIHPQACASFRMGSIWIWFASDSVVNPRQLHKNYCPGWLN